MPIFEIGLNDGSKVQIDADTHQAAVAALSNGDLMKAVAAAGGVRSNPFDAFPLAKSGLSDAEIGLPPGFQLDRPVTDPAVLARFQADQPSVGEDVAKSAGIG